MNFATFLKTLVILAVLFVMLYVGMNNTHEINFFFPIAGTTAKKPIHESAALIFFGRLKWSGCHSGWWSRGRRPRS